MQHTAYLCCYVSKHFEPVVVFAAHCVGVIAFIREFHGRWPDEESVTRGRGDDVVHGVWFRRDQRESAMAVLEVASDDAGGCVDHFRVAYPLRKIDHRSGGHRFHKRGITDDPISVIGDLENFLCL